MNSEVVSCGCKSPAGPGCDDELDRRVAVRWRGAFGCACDGAAEASEALAHRIPDAARDDLASTERVEVAGQGGDREGRALGLGDRLGAEEGGRLLSEDGEHDVVCRAFALSDE